MKNDILLYPSLNDDLISKIRFQTSKYNFYYTDKNDDEFDLVSEQLEASSKVYCIKDENGIWTQNDYNLCFRRKYCLRTFQYLFGENGVACTNAKLGIGIQWFSQNSRQRGMIPITIFSKEDDILEVEIDHKFGKAQLRGEIDFFTILYIAESGIPNELEGHLVNQEGYVLGQLDSFTIKLDGTSSTFPVFEVSEPGQPLWYVKCNWSDPTIDSFEDTVSINLNTSHKNYKYIEREQKTFDIQLLSEIMASAISIIIEKLRVDGALEEIVNNDDLEQGSVGQAVFYFKETLGWDFETPESVSLSVRKFFDQRM